MPEQITPNSLLSAAERSVSDARLLIELSGGSPASIFAVMAANALAGAKMLAAQAAEGCVS